MSLIKTYTVDTAEGNIVLTNIDDALEALKAEIEYAEDPDDEHDVLEYTIKVEKKYTQHDLDNLPELN